jgi:hypothetical protein
VLQLHSFTVFSAARADVMMDSRNRLKLDAFGGSAGRIGLFALIGETLCVCRCGWRRHKYSPAANAYFKPFQRPCRSPEAKGRRTVCANVLRKNFQDNRQKVARPILFHNYSRLDDSDPYENRSRIGKTVKLQHFLLDGMNAATRAKTPGIQKEVQNSC